MDTSKPKSQERDEKISTQQTPASIVTSESGSAESAPLTVPHVLHEVSVEADGSEDPGAGIEQMVESKKQSGSSLQRAAVTDANAPSPSQKDAPTNSRD